MYKLGQLKSD